MNLATLGAVIKFAIKIENHAKEFYEKDTEQFNELIIQYEKRIKKLKRIRRENTTEMILEPIQNFHSNSFESEILTKLESVEQPTNTIRKEVEKALSAFYLTAAEKVAFLSEIANLFETIAISHQKNSERT